ncbi:MAG: Inner membrane protein YbaL [Syntrophorhabdaceae bacterium PtaU1.Bin034]|jgi:CPA2 family monovalent cation:H+ antiporter-2|nr:MAG: Inner membrane protein YbaL [Syntrophorhabdaceae bacterium PtaU1.Bin034]
MEAAHSLNYLQSLVILFGVSAFVVFILGKLRMPSIVGFLLAGFAIGPSGLDLVKNVKEIETLAEIGVVLLMFTIGLEFSLKNLMALKKLVFGAGTLHVTITIALVAVLSFFWPGQTLNKAIFDGFLLALSSTAIVLKMILDRAEMHTSHGRSSIGMLIFEDLCVVPFMLLVPALAGNGGSAFTIASSMGKAVFIIAAVLLASKWAVPYLLHQVVSLRSRELFVITIVVFCLGTALLTSMFGLSLALGAFLAGIIISESEYSSQAVSDILPFKESFTGLFFVSVGMLLKLDVFLNSIEAIFLVVLLIILIKTLAVAISAYLAGQSLTSGLQSGFYLSQIGEFSFVLALSGIGQGLMDEKSYNIFLSASVVTMVLTPLMIKISSPAAAVLASNRFFRYLEKLHPFQHLAGQPEKKEDHVIIIGFGINGTNIARVLRESDIPYVILESNAGIVRRARRQGEPIYFGDGSGIEVLHKAGIGRARILVVVISDPSITRRIVQIARQANRELQIIVRTRLVAEVDHLLASGADEVVPEEFETSVEIFSKVLHYYHVPANIIRDRIDGVRLGGYLAFRTLKLPKTFLADRPELMKNVHVETYLVKQESFTIDHTLKDLNLRAHTGGTVIGVERDHAIHRMPPPSFRIKAGDILFLVGMRDDVRRAVDFLDAPKSPT